MWLLFLTVWDTRRLKWLSCNRDFIFTSQPIDCIFYRFGKWACFKAKFAPRFSAVKNIVPYQVIYGEARKLHRLTCYPLNNVCNFSEQY